MEMAIDFIKTQSFLGNLVCTFVVDSLWNFSDQPGKECHESDPEKCEKCVERLS